jgi:Tol biopolymer transport system component
MPLVCLMAAGLMVCHANIVPTQSISARNPAVPLTAGGDGDSIAPFISPDGRYVVFSSVANDLTPGGNDRFVLNVYLRDRTAGTTTLVSTNLNGTGGGNDYSALPQVSTNGQLVVFQSDASDLVSNDINNASDIFLRNVAAGTTTLISVAPDGSLGNGPSSDPIMTPDGRYVAFLSSATNLTSGISTNGMPDLFVRDLILGTNYLVSAGVTNGGNVAMTPDGRYVAFFSTATNLVAGVPATSRGEVYLSDRLSGTTTWASTNAAALAFTWLGTTNAPSYHPRLSDNGRYVAFKVGGTTNLPPGSGVALVLLYDAATATTTVISTNANGMQIGLDDNYGPEITPDGEFTAYVQHEGNINSNYCSVHVWDSQGAVDTLVSDPGNNGVITTVSMQPVLSAAGWFVAFLSNASNLVDDPVLSGFHIYLRNYVEGSLQLVDEDTGGTGSTDEQLALFSLSRFGRYVAFDSPDGSLVSGDNNQASDVFVRDLFLSTAEMDSKRNATLIPQTGDHLCLSQVSVSTNGQWVAFASVADDLVPNDTNNEPDVFVRDLLAGTTTLVSAGANGGPAWDSPSVSPVISGLGRYVVFISTATNLVAGQGVTTSANIFRRDLQTATTVLVSVSTNGVDGANGDCSSPVISQDGRYITFLSGAGNLVPGVSGGSTGFYRTFLRDIIAGTTTALTNALYAPSASTFPPSMSADGRYVAYSSSSSPGSYSVQLRVWDDQLGMDIYTNATVTTANALLNANGTRVFYLQTNNVSLVDDVMTGTNIFTFNYPVMVWGLGGFSADGRFVTFVARTNISSTTNIYLYDLQVRALTLVSSNYTPIISSAGNADLPAISADGRFVVYRSYAFGIVPGDNSPVPNIYRYDRLLGTNSTLTAGQAGLAPVLWDSKPAIDGDGGTVAFLSLGSGLVTPDLNRAPDGFAYAIDIGAPLDSDGDGIPDWWMIQYFGHPTGQAGDLSLAQNDADGDHMSNLQEYQAGTNPTNSLSALRMTTVAVIKPGPELDVSWNSVSNRIYFLQRSSSLAALPASPVLQSNIVGQAGTTTYQDTTAAGPGPYFYRVGVQQ